MAQTFNHNGTFTKMTLKYDDTRLSSAFRALGKKGDNELDKFLKKLAQEEMNQVKKELKKLAGGLASVVVPSPKGLPYGKGTNIHTKVADALKLHRINKNTYTIHTGKTYAQAEQGVLGQRGGKIAHIVAKGMMPFRYKRLPPLVMSSTRWFKATGNSALPTIGMKLRASHPGFYKTMDYIGLINERMVTNFEDRVGFNVIFAAARAAGFSTEDAGDLAVTVGAGTIKGSVGGKGIMSARRV